MRDESHWRGVVPPQFLYANREFEGVAVAPPDLQPGSWTGAGKAIYDPEEGLLLTARPRTARDSERGLAANIYRQAGGVTDFKLVTSLTKEDIKEIVGSEIHSIEGTQLLRDPLTGRWHFYVSVDVGERLVWGGLNWETVLLTAPELEGPWNSEGFVLECDREYDAIAARDGTIDIIDGRYVCIYKAKNEDRVLRPALATSEDGISWEKHGVLTVDKQEFRGFLSGTLFAGCGGPLFVGVETDHDAPTEDTMQYADEEGVPHGGGLVRFASYTLDRENGNLDLVFRTRWEPGSEYEYENHPILGYSSLVYDTDDERILIFVEGIDDEHTEQLGLQDTVEQVLVYSVDLSISPSI